MSNSDDAFLEWLKESDFSDDGQGPDIEALIKAGKPEDFLAFAIYMGTLLSPFRPPEAKVSRKEVMLTAWALTRPGITSKLFNFTKGLNERLEADPDTRHLVPLSGAAVQFFAPDGTILVEVVAVGSASRKIAEQNADYEPKVSTYSAEAAAEVGYILDPTRESANPAKKVTSVGGTISEAFRQQHEKIIDEQTAKFRAELDTVFNTWKGGDTNGGSTSE